MVGGGHNYTFITVASSAEGITRRIDSLGRHLLHCIRFFSFHGNRLRVLAGRFATTMANLFSLFKALLDIDFVLDF